MNQLNPSTLSVLNRKRKMWIKIYREAKTSGRSVEVIKARHKALHYCQYVKNWKEIS